MMMTMSKTKSKKKRRNVDAVNIGDCITACSLLSFIPKTKKAYEFFFALFSSLRLAQIHTLLPLFLISIACVLYRSVVILFVWLTFYVCCWYFFIFFFLLLLLVSSSSSSFSSPPRRRRCLLCNETYAFLFVSSILHVYMYLFFRENFFRSQSFIFQVDSFVRNSMRLCDHL